jgi:hypothetical protein
MPEKYEGNEIPFYWVTWPRETKGGMLLNYTAFVEVDARKGLVTFLELQDKAFYDYAFAQQISNRVCTPEPSKPPRMGRFPKPRLKPRPSYLETNQTAQAIAAWVDFCEKLGVKPGTDTNLASVNWELSVAYTNKDTAIPQFLEKKCWIDV